MTSQFHRFLQKLQKQFGLPIGITNLTLSQFLTIVGFFALLIGSVTVGYLAQQSQDVRQQASTASNGGGNCISQGYIDQTTGISVPASVIECTGIPIGGVGGCKPGEADNGGYIPYACKPRLGIPLGGSCSCQPAPELVTICSSHDSAPACRDGQNDGESCSQFNGTCKKNSINAYGFAVCACVANVSNDPTDETPVCGNDICQTGESCSCGDCTNTPACTGSGGGTGGGGTTPTTAPSAPYCEVYPKLRINGVGEDIGDKLIVNIGESFTLRAKIDNIRNGTFQEARFIAKPKDTTSALTLSPATRFTDTTQPYEATFKAEKKGKSYVQLAVRFKGIDSSICKFDLPVKVVAIATSPTPSSTPRVTNRPTNTPTPRITIRPTSTPTPTSGTGGRPTATPTPTSNNRNTPTPRPTGSIVQCNQRCISDLDCKHTVQSLLPMPDYFCYRTQRVGDGVCRLVSNPTSDTCKEVGATNSPSATPTRSATPNGTPSGTNTPTPSPSHTPVVNSTVTPIPTASGNAPSLPAAGGQSSTLSAVVITAILVLIIGAIGVLLLL